MPEVIARQVLYVEDDRINIILMEEVFRRLPDWRLECAEDGTQALDWLHGCSVQPALVLIDMNLPDMNGLELQRRLHADPRLCGLRCVALSADDQSDQVAAALASGFSDYWVKPIDVPRLTRALLEVLRAP
ncbi:N/A [soil metagenome]